MRAQLRAQKPPKNEKERIRSLLRPLSLSVIKWLRAQKIQSYAKAAGSMMIGSLLVFVADAIKPKEIMLNTHAAIFIRRGK